MVELKLDVMRRCEVKSFLGLAVAIRDVHPSVDVRA